jgi:hypothetical protein
MATIYFSGGKIKFVRVEEFQNRKAAWASKHGEKLEVLYR